MRILDFNKNSIEPQEITAVLGLFSIESWFFGQKWGFVSFSGIFMEKHRNIVTIKDHKI